MDKWKSIMVTKSLEEIIMKTCHPKDLDIVLEQTANTIEFFQKEFSRVSKEANVHTAVHELYRLLDQEVKNQLEKQKVSCKKGCANCCHIRVFISPQEAALIVAYCQMNSIPIDTELLKLQATFPADSYFLQEKSACVFLDNDNTCKIYEMRPINCRKYLVSSDPELCNAKTNRLKNSVAKAVSYRTEVIASVIAAQVSMPEAILNVLNQQK